ncbi:MAG TPA: GrpB family protein [Candidatus Cybelea sp.]|jgi:GrpB-like predicted nucleotidyltransferase (UPF0157 family)
MTSGRSDEEMRAVTIGEPIRHNDRIVLVQYDPKWPRQFEHEAERVREALCERALRVEHVGSTSVPGLPAKPFIDMLLQVADSSNEPAYVPALESAGYVLRIREPHWHEHRLFNKPGVEIKLHVFGRECLEVSRMLAFRDRLRADPADRELYARTKRALAEREWKYVQDYADAKGHVIEAILGRLARETPDACQAFERRAQRRAE